MLLRLALSALLVFGVLFALIVGGTRMHRELVAADDVAAPAPAATLHWDAEGDPAAAAEADVAALRGFLGVAPARRLETALAGADTRFLAIRDAALRVPGVADAEHGFDPMLLLAIPGTTPTPASAEHADLIRRAQRYALAYNALLLRRGSAPPSSADAARSPARTAPSGVGATR